MDYIEYIKNMRAAFRLISEKLPEIQLLIDKKRWSTKDFDPDFNIIAMPDMEFRMLEKGWEEVEEKLNYFDCEQEYGSVNTLTKSEMRGFK
jgi:hypothetical protein